MTRRCLILTILCILFGLALFGCNQKTDTELSVKGQNDTIPVDSDPTEENAGTEEEFTPPQQETAQPPEQDPVVIENTEIPYPLEMHFSSGVGAWSSDIVLNSDGTFTGYYHDSDMGYVGKDFPCGTVFISNFSGKFGNIRQVNEYTLALTLEDVCTEKEPDQIYIEDQIRFITTMPHGFVTEDAELVTEYMLFLPNTPVSECSEWMLSWWPLRYGDEKPDTLEHYALYNTVTEQTFFTYPEISN